MSALASCQEALSEETRKQTKKTSPHVFNVPASTFQYAQGDAKHGQKHHIRHIEELFEIENKGAAGEHQEWDHQQRYHPQHIHSGKEKKVSDVDACLGKKLLKRCPTRLRETEKTATQA